MNDRLKKLMKQLVVVDCNIRHPEHITASHLGQQMLLAAVAMVEAKHVTFPTNRQTNIFDHNILANPGTLAPHPRFF